MKDNYRKYGPAPIKTVLVHGGPGGAGSLVEVAKELAAAKFGVLECLQTKANIKEQTQELYDCIVAHCNTPVTIIGHSWGAWLSILLYNQFPQVIRKIILVSSGPFEDKYAKDITSTRINRLNKEDKKAFFEIIDQINDSKQANINTIFSRMGKIISIADAYHKKDQSVPEIDYRFDIFDHVWKEATWLRRSNKLLELTRNIDCPVVAIHGDSDPHPYEGVEEPLKKNIKDFRFFLLEKCGHDPWNETYAYKHFYEILEAELRN